MPVEQQAPPTPGTITVTPFGSVQEGRRALIVGITGQDGSYLADFLVANGYQVSGMVRPRAQGDDFSNLTRATRDKVSILHADVTDAAAVADVIGEVKPEEIYNLAAMSFVPASWPSVGLTMATNAQGAINVFSAARALAPNARIYQASTSEMYGNVAPPQNELSPMFPVSPYGVSKLAAHRMAHVYRMSYGQFIACGICFNHESPRRGSRFVSRKIARGVAEVHLGLRDGIGLGDLSAQRDWGFAPDYVVAMWQMLQLDTPEDIVIATGRSYSVQDFVREACLAVGIEDASQVVWTDPDLVRPTEIYRLVGNATKAQRVLGWRPTIDFKDMVRLMVRHELDCLRGNCGEEA